jgi:hypothetical protein
MGRKKRIEIKYKQEEKKKKRRLRLTKAGKNPNEYFYGGVYVGRLLK